MPKKVIVVGGGIAGLSAATKIHDAQITLLEGKQQLGGRIHTLRNNVASVELGAEFVHGRNKALLDAIGAARLNLRPVSMKNHLCSRGHLQPVDTWDQFSELTQRIDPNARDQSFLTFLDQQGLDEKNRSVMLAFAEGFNAANATRLSTHSLRFAEYFSEQMEGEQQARVAEGYGALVNYLADKARQAGVTLSTETFVKTIRWRRGHVEIETERGGANETFSAEAAIITLPLGVLKARVVKFDPPVPEKEEAIAGLEFGNVMKITFVFRKFWWPDHDFGFIHALDEALPTWWSDSRGPILTGWAGGPKADALLNHSPAQLELLAIEILAGLFSIPAETIRGHLVSSHTHNWSKDPFACGAYSFIPVNGLFLPKQLGAPVENTLFFAGEATATDAQMGTVFGALESGLRVARELQRM